MRNFAFVLAAAAFVSTASAQEQQAVAPLSAEQQRAVEHLRTAALESDLAWEIVEGLVTDVGPRLAGTEAEARARDWSVAMLRAQRFSNVRIEPFTMPFWDAVREEAHIVSPAPQPMVTVALAGSPSTPQGGVEAEVVRFESLAALTAASASAVQGRIVFIDERMVRTQDGTSYSVAVAKRGGCAPAAQAKGAVACIIRSVGTDTHRFAHQGGNVTQPAGVSLPAAAIAPADADTLGRLAQRGVVRVRLNIEVDARDSAPSGNVIAEIPGRERPEEIVLLTAHLDSWDLGQGAIDDGAGVAIITAAAKLIRDLPRRPRRTIRILLAGAEETGVHGGAAYGRMHANDRHAVAAESDFGAGRIYAFRTRFNQNAQPYARAIQQALAPLGIISSAAEARGGSDTYMLHAAGVAMADLAQDGSDYFDYHHTANDTLAAINPAALQQNVAAWAVFAYLAADTDIVLTPAAPPSAPR